MASSKGYYYCAFLCRYDLKKNTHLGLIITNNKAIHTAHCLHDGNFPVIAGKKTGTQTAVCSNSNLPRAWVEAISCRYIYFWEEIYFKLQLNLDKALLHPCLELFSHQKNIRKKKECVSKKRFQRENVF